TPSASTAAGGLSISFFQAEDGIRDRNVTGVQTCALPIYPDHGIVRWAPGRVVRCRGGHPASDARRLPRRRLGRRRVVVAGTVPVPPWSQGAFVTDQGHDAATRRGG